MSIFEKKLALVLYAALLGIAVAVSACNAQQPAQPGAQQSTKLGAQQASQSSAPRPAQSGLKTVDNPGGGQFVYGTLTGQTSRTDALVYMLHMVHTNLGDKPVLGKLLQSRDGSSLATFFTLTATTAGNKSIAGLVIISMPDKGAPQAAVLYDDAKNFPSSEPAMMKSLTAAWKGSLGGMSPSANDAGQSGQSAPSSATPQLYPATAGDRSAMIKMPKSWKIDAVSGGALIAEGDRGEMVFMGIIYQNIINPQSPMGQRLISGPMASRGPKVVCPITSNLFTNYVCVFNQTRHNNGKPQGSFNFLGATPQPGSPQSSVQPIVARFTVDFNDGMGLRNGSAYLSFMMPPNPQAASWAMMASMSNIPQKHGSAVDPTLKAVVESYSQNAAVIAKEGAADLNRIRQQGLANQAQADAINQRRETSAAAFDQHNADIDWQSKINQNYILDRSVIRDTADTVHATTSNNLAEALVKSNPNKLEYVPNQQLIRGVDY
jgi:hypothetical protein